MGTSGANHLTGSKYALTLKRNGSLLGGEDRTHDERGHTMPAPRQLPDTETLKRLRRQGWTYDDIAAEYGVTKGAVYLQLSQAKATKPRPNYKHLIPWTVKTEHQYAHPAMMLRLLGRREKGDTIPDVKARMLDKWLRDIGAANVVVCYHPDMIPNAASPKTGGWFYSSRTKSDGDSIIRFVEPAEVPKVVNPHALT